MSDFNTMIIEEFRRNGGHVETAGFGDDLVLLHSTGARSGQPRVTPLMAVPTDDGWLIGASNAGSATEPAWAHNLRAHPEVGVETGDGTVAATAVEPRGADRDAAWARLVAAAPGFGDYASRTTRTIAVFRLVRAV